jgi:hypothetical protein
MSHLQTNPCCDYIEKCPLKEFSLSCTLYSNEHEHGGINKEAREAPWFKITVAHLAVADHANFGPIGLQMHATS